MREARPTDAALRQRGVGRKASERRKVKREVRLSTKKCAACRKPVRYAMVTRNVAICTCCGRVIKPEEF